MTCKSCNTINPDGSKFCEKCGAPFSNQMSAPAPTPTPAPAPEIKTSPAPKKKGGAGKVIGIILGILAGLGVLGVIIVLILVLLGGGVIATIFGVRSGKTPAINDTVTGESSSVGTVEKLEEAEEPEELPEEPEDGKAEPQAPPSPALACPYTVMNVTSNLGLNIRSMPSTNGTILGVLIQNRHVFVERTENGWAYIKSGYLHGWCSMDYLEPVAFQSGRVYTEADIQNGFDEANKIISGYHGTPVPGARTDITVSNVTAYFDACNAVYQYNNSFGEQFQKLVPFAADSERVYYFVEDPTIKTVDDLCKKYFGMFSDDIADSCLRGKVLVVDGKLAIGFESDYYSGLHISHTYNVSQISAERIDVTVIAMMYNENTIIRDGSGKPTDTSPSYQTSTTYSCVWEDNAWVFDAMEVIYE